jgi:hypothetical protein
VPARSATRAQERLASFQRGIRNARAAAQGTNGAGSDGEPGEENGDATREADLSQQPELCLLAAQGVSDLPSRPVSLGWGSYAVGGVMPSAWRPRCWRRRTGCPH